MNDTLPDAPKLVEKKGDMTSTAEKLYELYDKARAAFRAIQSQVPPPLLTDAGSDSKTDD